MTTALTFFVTPVLLTLLIISGCDDRPQRWEESLRLSERADEPASKLAKCMTEHLKSSAAFKIGYQEVLEGRIDGVPGEPGYNRLGFGPPGALFKTSDALIADTGEALAVYCGANRDSWKLKPVGVGIDSSIELKTEQGVERMSYAFASSKFEKYLEETPDYQSGKKKAIDEQNIKSRKKLAFEDEIKQTENMKKQDFAVDLAPKP